MLNQQLFVDEFLLPPGESVLVVRDNDFVRYVREHDIYSSVDVLWPWFIKRLR